MVEIKSKKQILQEISEELGVRIPILIPEDSDLNKEKYVSLEDYEELKEERDSLDRTLIHHNKQRRNIPQRVQTI